MSCADEPHATSNGPTEHEYPDAAALQTALCGLIGGDLAKAVERDGRASLVVSGGSTPIPLFRNLSALDLPWEKVAIVPADERWVPADHEDSNENMIRRVLLRGNAARAAFVALKTAHESPEAAAADRSAAVAKLPRPFSVVILGMGNDGHTASLFPDTEALQAALADDAPLCAAVRPKHAPHPRISLTLPALLDSRRIILHLKGEDKHRTYRKALEPGAVEAMPVRAILRQRKVPVEVFWSP